MGILFRLAPLATLSHVALATDLTTSDGLDLPELVLPDSGLPDLEWPSFDTGAQDSEQSDSPNVGAGVYVAAAQADQLSNSAPLRSGLFEPPPQFEQQFELPHLEEQSTEPSNSVPQPDRERENEPPPQIEHAASTPWHDPPPPPPSAGSQTQPGVLPEDPPLVAGLQACSANPACSQLAGNCCPTDDGMVLDCCHEAVVEDPTSSVATSAAAAAAGWSAAAQASPVVQVEDPAPSSQAEYPAPPAYWPPTYASPEVPPPVQSPQENARAQFLEAASVYASPEVPPPMQSLQYAASAPPATSANSAYEQPRVEPPHSEQRVLPGRNDFMIANWR